MQSLASATHVAATACLGLAILHSFFAEEVELTFAFWAGIWIFITCIHEGIAPTLTHLSHLSFKEPIFVFVIMSLAASRLIFSWIQKRLSTISLRSLLIFGPLLGSLITEPAAITVTALLLKDRIFSKPISVSLKYALLATLFVNVSVGGTLTPFAAPPVVMVARAWNWGFLEMLHFFAPQAIATVVTNTFVFLFLFRHELRSIDFTNAPAKLYSVNSKTGKLQPFKAPFQVGLFLASLVILGEPQSWWVTPLLQSLSLNGLFLGATLLTAITDNAALTYLGAQTPGLSELMKRALVSGAVAGGGLTLIANAPNPVGFSILRESFGPNGLSPWKLLKAATLPTLIAMACFGLFFLKK